MQAKNNTPNLFLKKALSPLLLCFVMLSTVVGCVYDIPESPVKNDDSAYVRISVVNPSAATRAEQTDGETLITEVMVLAMDAVTQTYLYKAEGSISSSTNNTTVFEANLVSSETPVMLYIVANANDAVNGANLLKGDTKEEITAALIAPYSPGVTSSFPMFGNVRIESLDAGAVNNIQGIQMLRSIARVDVDATGVGNLPEDPSTPIFRLENVYVYRVNDSIQLIPDAVGSGSGTSPVITAPSVPAGTGTITRTGPFASANNILSETIYIPESAHDDNVLSGITRIVIGGSYRGGDITYYRVDFYPDNSAERGNVLRNHRYLVNIANVSKDGWSNPDEAANNEATGLAVRVVDWDDNTTEMWWQGDHYYGLSSREVTTQYRAASTATFHINTTLSEGQTLQWVDANGNALAAAGNGENTLLPSPDPIDNNWFALNTVYENNKPVRIQVTAKLLNDTYLTRISYVMLEINQWRILLTIKQSSQQSTLDRDIILIAGNEIGHLGNSSGAYDMNTAYSLKASLQAQFSQTGTIKVNGFSFSTTATGWASLTDAQLAGADILYMTYANNPSAATMNKVFNWLQSDRRHMLILSFDNAGTNAQAFAHPYISGDISNMNFNNPSANEECPVTKVAGGEYFWRDGPFTTTEISSSAVYRHTDNTWGRLTPSATSTIIPLIVTTSGQMVYGVDTEKRIFYIGDSQYGSYQDAAVYIGKRFNRSDGDVFQDSDIAKMLMNVWAWMVEEVILAE